MNIYFCLSYLSVPHTITLIKENHGTNYLIVSSNVELYKFFTELFDKKKILFLQTSSITFPFSIKFIYFPVKLVEVFILKWRAWKYFRKVHDANIYFFFNGAAFFYAWLIYKLSKNNKLYYQEDIDLSVFPEKKEFVTWVNKYFIKILYNEAVVPIDQGNGNIAYKMSQDFISKVKVNKIEIDLSSKNISNWLNMKFNFPKGDILFLSSFIKEFGTNEDEYIKQNDNLLCELRNSGYKIHLKLHPRCNIKNSLEKELFEIPKYYPANLLLNYKVIIGYASATLAEAANNGILSISLVDFYKFATTEEPTNLKSYLISNLIQGKMILFPLNINEIRKLLIENIAT